MTKILSNEAQESINRLLCNHHISNMTYSILEFTSCKSEHKSDSQIVVDAKITTNRIERYMKCDMTVELLLQSDDSDKNNIVIHVECKINRLGKRYERCIENISYIIASNYMNNHYLMVTDKELNVPEHLYSVRCMEKVSFSEFLTILLRKIKRILYSQVK